MGEYCEGQWWLKELDAMAGTPDQRRAVAVVRKMMAEQHQGEPVAWLFESPEGLEPVSGFTRDPITAKRFKDAGWTVEQVHTHGDPGEVERLREEVETLRSQLGAEISKSTGLRTLADGAKKWRQRAMDSQLASLDLTNDNNELHAQLAEREALLRDARGCVQDSANNADCAANQLLYTSLLSEIDVALSASAEPSAQSITKPNAECTICRDLGDECMTCEEQRKPSAPVERDKSGKCLDGGDCGVGGICKWCPHASADMERKP